LVEKTLKKIRSRQMVLDGTHSSLIKDAIPAIRKTSLGGVSLTSGTCTPPEERAEFECYRQKLVTAKQLRMLAQTSTEEKDAETSRDESDVEEASDTDDISSTQDYPTTEDEEEDEAWFEFHDALETTLTQNLSTQSISEDQARDIIENFNRRRSSLAPVRRSLVQQSTPGSAKSTSPAFYSPAAGNGTVYYTPRQTRFSPTTDSARNVFETPRTHKIQRSTTLRETLSSTPSVTPKSGSILNGTVDDILPSSSQKRKEFFASMATTSVDVDSAKSTKEEPTKSSRSKRERLRDRSRRSTLAVDFSRCERVVGGL
jgi:hypothetical protein